MSLVLLVFAMVAEPTETPKVDAAEKKICRYDVVTGSIMPSKRTCRTVKEWQASDAKNGDEADRFNHRPLNQAQRPIND